jgi:tetratricopeptide (TPR) repeat protein
MKKTTGQIGIFQWAALPAVLIAVVCVAVLVVHWPVLSAKALSFDDYQYVIRNPFVRNPSLSSTKRFLTEIYKPSTVTGYYQPLTMISLMLDYAAGGRENNLMPFHRTALALHVANTALVIILLYLLFGNIWVAAGVGLLFGLHPMTVEPVAWLGERKTLLAAFFSFWSLLFYLLFTRTRAKKYYVVCIFAYLFALMSKPVSLPLPFVMLLMDYWPLKRFRRSAIIEKLPLLAITLLFAFITIISQMRSAVGLLPGQAQHGLLDPLLIFCHNVVFYPLKILWPVNLTSYYPHPNPLQISNPQLLACIFATVLLAVLLIVSLRWTKAALTGSLIFLVAILPTMQIIKFSYFIASDKFVYLPAIGLLMMLAALLLRLYNNNPRRALIIFVGVLILSGAEAFAVRRYLSYWRDTVTLYEYMLKLSPDAVPVYGNLASAYGRLGRPDKVVELLEHAVAVDPNEGRTYINLGVAYMKLNRYKQAIAVLERSVRLRPYDADAYINLASAYIDTGRFEDGIDCCNKAIEINPDSPNAYVTLAGAFGNLGRFPEAIETYKKGIELMPDNPVARFGLGLAYLKNGDPDAAAEQYEILRKLDQDQAARLRSYMKP